MRFSLPLVTVGLVAALPSFGETQPPAYVVTTFAGTSSVGATDGTGPSARFHRPQGLALDNAGNVYVADSDNATLRKITPAGVVTTLAGVAGQPGAVDGLASAARFNFPASLVCDPAGNLFVADANNHAIRRVSPAGEVTTYAGALGTAGADDGPRLTARFHRPEGLALDAAGNLFVADAGNHTLRKIAVDGNVTTLAGAAGESGRVDGPATAARFNRPFRLALDRAGNLYISESGNYDIRQLSPSGEVSTVYHARYASLYGSIAYRNAPAGLVVTTNGRLLFVDSFTDTINELLLPADEFRVLAGQENTWGDADGPALSARFNEPNALAIDATGNLIIAELGNNTVRRLSTAGAVTTLAGLGYSAARGAVDGPGSSARFEESLHLTATSDGTLYVADSLNRLIRKVSPTGVVSTPLGGNSPENFIEPVAVVPDPSGVLYVADRGRFEVFEVSNTITRIAGLYSMIGRYFFAPVALARAENGDLFTADQNSSVKRVYRSSTGWTFEDFAGTSWTFGSDDGIGAAARFRYPEAIVAAPSGEIYVADTGNHTIRKIAADRTVTTLAGRAGAMGSADGPSTDARFNTPQGLARDATGNLFVADRYNHTIRKIAPDGTVSTVIGSAGLLGQIDGLSTDARLYYPQSVTVDEAGNLYIASGSVIRKAQPTRAPAFTRQPLAATVVAGGNVTLSAEAVGVPSPTYQWLVDNRAIPNATASTLTLTNTDATDAGTYTAVATNALGSTTSASAILTVTAGSVAPAGSGSGGGGAPSIWAGLALAALATARTIRFRREKRRPE
jgi:sugar lactone lactonase YvrE